MFGGLMKGIEKEGLIISSKPPFDLGLEKFKTTGSNWQQIRPLESNGSTRTVFYFVFLI
jgi:hypothetical protein